MIISCHVNSQRNISVVEKNITFTINNVALRNLIICHSTINKTGYIKVRDEFNTLCKRYKTILVENNDGYGVDFSKYKKTALESEHSLLVYRCVYG